MSLDGEPYRFFLGMGLGFVSVRNVCTETEWSGELWSALSAQYGKRDEIVDSYFELTFYLYLEAGVLVE